jgi:thiol-disulfide isomerase/thioredoxin
VIATHVQAADRRPLPEFTSSRADDWINGPALSVAGLRGRVLLVDVWTYGCWNCYRSFPWLNGLEERLAEEPFQVVGIHSPEFERERDRARVAAKVGEFGLRHPVMIDNDLSYWRALRNRYWPSFYLVDKQGTIRHRFEGETHAGDRRAVAIEQRIEALLAE